MAIERLASLHVAVDRAADGDYRVVTALAPEGVQALGRFSRVADVWRAIDAIDVEDD